MSIAMALLIAGVAAMAAATAIDDNGTVKRIFFCGGLAAIYAAAILMIWGG